MAQPHARPRRRGGTPLRDAQAYQRPGSPAGGVGGAGREDRGSSAGIKKRRSSQRRRRLKRSRSLAGPQLVEREAERPAKAEDPPSGKTGLNVARPGGFEPPTT